MNASDLTRLDYDVLMFLIDQQAFSPALALTIDEIILGDFTKESCGRDKLNKRMSILLEYHLVALGFKQNRQRTFYISSSGIAYNNYLHKLFSDCEAKLKQY